MNAVANNLGWFDDPSQTEPAHEPGLDVPCPVCGGTLNDGQPRKTMSLMLCEGPDRSYFYRAHKKCWEALNAEQQGIIEGEIIDAELERLHPLSEARKT